MGVRLPGRLPVILAWSGRSAYNRQPVHSSLELFNSFPNQNPSLTSSEVEHFRDTIPVESPFRTDQDPLRTLLAQLQLD